MTLSKRTCFIHCVPHVCKYSRNTLQICFSFHIFIYSHHWSAQQRQLDSLRFLSTPRFLQLQWTEAVESPWQFRPLVGLLTSTLTSPQEIQSGTRKTSCLGLALTLTWMTQNLHRHSIKQWLLIIDQWWLQFCWVVPWRKVLAFKICVFCV